ncbi:helix-turn-helix domain-containing protein [Jeotgalibaca porci]|uniref:helix-turn-helix domain-containing protein n=1 Tax=Jeotgalibaca porci TaxID=1868793 RepID=UPI0035A0279D
MITKGTSFYIQKDARNALKRQDLSQVGLSEIIGTKKTTLNRYMTDSPTPVESIAQIAAVLANGSTSGFKKGI